MLGLARMNRAFAVAKTLLSRTTILATVAILGVFCVAIVQLSALPFLKALDCAERGEGPFPFYKELCRKHVFAFRGSEADIASLQANQGAMHLLAAKSGRHTLAERAEMLTFLAHQGLNINAKEADQWTPLHAAIRDNDVDGATLLLGLHPFLGIKAGPDDTTPLQMARDLHRETIVLRILAEIAEQRRMQAIMQSHGKRLEEVQLYNAEFPGTQIPVDQELKNTD